MREPTNLLTISTLIIYEVLDVGSTDTDITWSPFSRSLQSRQEVRRENKLLQYNMITTVPQMGCYGNIEKLEKGGGGGEVS